MKDGEVNVGSVGVKRDEGDVRPCVGVSAGAGAAFTPLEVVLGIVVVVVVGVDEAAALRLTWSRANLSIRLYPSTPAMCETAFADGQRETEAGWEWEGSRGSRAGLSNMTWWGGGGGGESGSSSEVEAG